MKHILFILTFLFVSVSFAQIEPIKKETQDPIDPFFLLSGIGKVVSLSNAAMDGIIYGK